MNLQKRIILPCAIVTAGVMMLAGCVPVNRVPRPTLDQVRSGNARGQIVEDATLLPGEISGDIDRIDRGRREIHVVVESGRGQIIPYDLNRTRVVYHGWDYSIDHLEAGDRIAFRSLPRDVAYIDRIRVLEPVQARATPPIARPAPRPVDFVEGTVERVDPSLGTFEIRTHSGRTVTVSVPYNARAVDVDNFRSLRRGDHVRVEGQFVHPESLQLLAFASPREQADRR
jgi:hypothetical protein